MTPEQQAFAENLVAATLTDLPQWADPAVAEAAGFHSIGDAGTGHEHYIQWDWIDDDVVARPRRPREPRVRAAAGRHEEAGVGDVHAADDVALDDVPDWGGPLMQWHIHDNLCYTDDPVAPQVARPHPRRRHVPGAARQARPRRR